MTPILFILECFAQFPWQPGHMTKITKEKVVFSINTLFLNQN